MNFIAVIYILAGVLQLNYMDQILYIIKEKSKYFSESRFYQYCNILILLIAIVKSIL